MTDRHPLVWIAMVFIVGLVGAFLLPHLLLQEPTPDGWDERPANVVSESSSTPPVARVLLSAIWGPASGYERIRPLIGCIEEVLDGPVQLVQRQTYAEANSRIASGDIDIALICTGATNDPEVRRQMDAPFRLRFDQGDMYRSVVIVRASDPASDIEDLRGSPMAWVDIDSLTGFIAPHVELARQGLDADSFFGPTTFTHGHDRSIRSVAQGLVRAATVDEEVLAQSSLADQVRVVWRSPPYPAPPVLTRRDRPDLVQALAAIADRPECFTGLGARGLVPAQWSDYDFMSGLLKETR